jgi:hypothetical protein
MATREQMSKVKELVDQGWKVITPSPIPPSAPIELESPDGNKVFITPSGEVLPVKVPIP